MSIQARSSCFRGLRRGYDEFGAKNPIPETTGNPETIFVVCVMVVVVILLKVLHGSGEAVTSSIAYTASSDHGHELFMMQEVMSDIVADVPKYSPAKDSYRGIPVVEEDDV